MNHVNSEGLRDDEESLQNPSIVVFGDSFTMGWGVEQEKSYPQLLENLSNEKVLNAGVSSFGTAREMILMKKLNFPNIKTVIIQYHANDHEENVTYEQNKYNLPIRKRETYDSLKKNISDRIRYFPFKYTSGIARSFARTMVGRKNNAIRKATVEAETFLNIIQNSELNKVASQIIVFEIGSDNVHSDDFVNAIDHLLTRDKYSDLKITTVRLSGILAQDDYFILDDHINEKGHEKIAARLNGYLHAYNPIFAENQ